MKKLKNRHMITKVYYWRRCKQEFGGKMSGNNKLEALLKELDDFFDHREDEPSQMKQFGKFAGIMIKLVKEEAKQIIRLEKEVEDIKYQLSKK
jgi:hypothetical protein